MEAMISLLGKYDWADVNVQQICDEADIARSTFYSHFDNKQELYDFGFARLEQHIKKAVGEKASIRSLDENQKFGFLPELLEHIKLHQPIFCCAGVINPNSPSNMLVFAKFKSLTYEFIKTEIEASSFSKKTTSVNLIFISGGIYGLMEAWWGENTKTPVDQVVASIDEQVERALV